MWRGLISVKEQLTEILRVLNGKETHQADSWKGSVVVAHFTDGVEESKPLDYHDI